MSEHLTRAGIEESITAIIAETFSEVPKDKISLDTPFIDGFKADSIDAVELALAIEDEYEKYKIRVTDETRAKFVNGRAIVNYIVAQAKAKRFYRER